jgi:hypothetical protein
VTSYTTVSQPIHRMKDRCLSPKAALVLVRAGVYVSAASSRTLAQRVELNSAQMCKAVTPRQDVKAHNGFSFRPLAGATPMPLPKMEINSPGAIARSSAYPGATTAVITGAVAGLPVTVSVTGMVRDPAVHANVTDPL